MTNYAYKSIFWKLGKIQIISGFGIIYKVRFDKVPLNAASYQTADSTLSLCISNEPGLKGLRITSLLPSTKNAQEEHNKHKRAKNS